MGKGNRPLPDFAGAPQVGPGLRLLSAQVLLSTVCSDIMDATAFATANAKSGGTALPTCLYCSPRLPRNWELVGEGLKAGRFAHGDGPILIWVDVGAPMDIAFSQDSASLPVRVQAPISLRVIAPVSKFHPCGEQMKWQIAPTTALRNMRHPLKVDECEFRCNMVEEPCRPVPSLPLVF